MKAIIQEKYGDVDQLELTEVEKPTIKDNEILVEIHAVNIASGDWRVNTLSVPKLLKPIMRAVFGFSGPRKKVRGMSASGKIVEIGSKVTTFKINDEVYFIDSMNFGCLADYKVLKDKSVIAKKPGNISHKDAAPVSFGAMSAYHFINGNNISKDMRVLIYGASGSVGSYAVQLAKHYGAIVTAVSSRKNHDVLEKIGADHLIDYTTTDITQITKKFDVVFDAVGKVSKSKTKNLLNDTGKYYSIKSPTKEAVNRLHTLNEIIEKGNLKTVIDSEYTKEQYESAHIKTYSGHKVGNVVIKWKE